MSIKCWERQSCLTERDLAAQAVALGATDVRGWSRAETRLIRDLPLVPAGTVAELRERIRAGEDPLGDLFSTIRSPQIRRKKGATFTPLNIVDAILDRAAEYGLPQRVIDPGAGSARFLLAAAHRFQQASLTGIEVDPLPALIARGNIAAAGLTNRAEVLLEDYCSARLQKIDSPTLFIGNPLYVRHHLLKPQWKRWLVTEASRHGLSASRLAGLHAYFYLATLGKAAEGDFGSFITAAEWLDVNYGRLIRELFVGPLGGRRILVIEPTALPFPDAATTAAITQFQVGSRPKTVSMRCVRNLDELTQTGGDHEVRREHLQSERRWSHLIGCRESRIQSQTILRSGLWTLDPRPLTLRSGRGRPDTWNWGSCAVFTEVR